MPLTGEKTGHLCARSMNKMLKGQVAGPSSQTHCPMLSLHVYDPFEGFKRKLRVQLRAR